MNSVRFAFTVVIGIACGFPVFAKSGAYEWYFHKVGMLGTDFFFEAAFGDPETDSRLMRFTCTSGVISVQGPFPNASLDRDDAEGTHIRMIFSTPDGGRRVLDAEIAEAGDGINYVGKITADHPVISALVAGKAVRVQRVNFRQIIEVPARGAAQPLKSFVAACRVKASKEHTKP
jgi:hypothetical protein